MAFELTGTMTRPDELRRHYHRFLTDQSITASGALNSFATGNATSMILMVKATSSAGTPNYTLSLQTAFEDVAASYVTVSPISDPDFAAINDEVWHVYTVNLANCMQFARIYITLNAGDGGDDVFNLASCFLFGSFSQAQNVSVEVSPTSPAITKTVATGAAALALTTAVAHAWKLSSVLVHFSAAPTTVEDLVISVDSGSGAAYDTVLFRCTPASSAGTDFVFIPDAEFILASGDEIAVAFTNTDTRTYGATVIGEKI